MDIIEKILELNLEESERTELLMIAKNYEKKAGFFSGLMGLILITVIACGGFWVGKFYETSASIDPINAAVTLSKKSCWGLFSNDQTYVCRDDNLEPKN
jgi:hypothetical protein